MLSPPTQLTPQPPNALAACISPQRPPLPRQQNTQQPNMVPLTQPPLIAQQFRPDPGIHSGGSISGARGGSPAPNAYQSNQVPETLPASLRGANMNVGPGAPGEAGTSSQAQPTQGGQLFPGQGEIPGQPGGPPPGQPQPPPGAFTWPTLTLQQQSKQIRNFMGSLSQRTMEELLKFRDAFARQRVTIESNIARLRQDLGRVFQAPKEVIENIMRDRRKYELLSDAIAKEITKREMR